MFIIFLSLSNSVLADSSLSYKVKPSDSRTYKITKDQLPGKNKPSSFQQTFQDGTSSNVSIQEGLIFTVTICYIIGSGVNDTVYTKATINGKTSSCIFSYEPLANLQNYPIFSPLDSILSPYTSPVIPVTNNLTYYQNLAPKTTYAPVFPTDSVYITTFTLHGNNLLKKVAGNTSQCFQTYCGRDSNLKINLNIEINIDVQTGWYTNVSALETFTNGTIYSQFEATQITNNSGSGLPGFEIPSVLSIIIAVPIVLIKRKRN